MIVKNMTHLKLVLVFTFLPYFFGPVAFADGLRKSRTVDEMAVPTGVVFFERVSERNGLCSRPASCWLPTAADVAALEKSLPSFLRSAGEPGAKAISENLQSYRRKYFGYKKDGSHSIFMTGLCSHFWHPGKMGFQSVRPPGMDLGECYFSANYNVDKGKFEDLYIDGETS